MVLPLAVLVAYLVFCVLVGLCGSQRRMGFTGTFLLSVVITPVLGASPAADHWTVAPRRSWRAAPNSRGKPKCCVAPGRTSCCAAAEQLVRLSGQGVSADRRPAGMERAA